MSLFSSTNQRTAPTLASLLALLLTGVGCEVPRADDSAQQAVMHDLAYEVMLPINAEVEDEALALATAVGAYCDAPSDETLSAAQDAWRAARVPWKHAEAFRFGPAEDLRLGSAIDFWPVRPDSVESAITAAPVPVTPEHIASLGASAKGMPALEYLLFDPAGALGGSDEVAKRRCSFARALGETIGKDATTIHQAWSPEGGAFVDQVALAGAGSKLFATGQDGVARVVNLIISQLHQISEKKLGGPLGVSTGAAPDSTTVESRFSDNSTEDLLNNLRGMEEIYLGQHGEHSGKGLSSLVRPKSAPIDDAVRKALEDAKAKAAAIPGPLRLAIVNDAAAVQAALDSAKALRRLFTADVASVLGVSVTLSDSDGD
ncbi:imelysin family protein [Polyangium aurulentum]|uniref:imelysin family protein n=1 Tax=Polyangium aurulentum TaxID=2567896 RepID=UPI0010AE414B|nr:imelysin family protein [Polyangium aurulentum]UQA62238.1 imelysin family protein [Polyangium aurulentum]